MKTARQACLVFLSVLLVSLWGLLEFRVPLDVFEIELLYVEGALEWTAVPLSLIAGGVWAVWLRLSPARTAAFPVGRKLTAFERRRKR